MREQQDHWGKNRLEYKLRLFTYTPVYNRLKHCVAITNCPSSSLQCVKSSAAVKGSLFLPLSHSNRGICKVWDSHPQAIKDMATLHVLTVLYYHSLTNLFLCFLSSSKWDNCTTKPESLLLQSAHGFALQERYTGILALPSAYCQPMISLYQYLGWIGRNDGWMHVWNLIVPVLFMRCRVLVPQI